MPLKKNLTSRYSLSREAYPLLKEYGIPSYYYPEMINKALALVKTYRKRIRKGKKATKPQVKKMMLSTYYGFKIKNGKILIPLSGERYGREYEEIELNNYVQGA
ncbi:MAG: RNA-guided endonuclease InsQ/TnpB family protein, partial [Thermoplasmata archaeon]